MKRFFLQIFVILTFLWTYFNLAFGWEVYSMDEKTIFVETEFGAFNKNLPILVLPRKNINFYSDPLLAVSVEKLIVDGHEINREVNPQFLDDLNTRSTKSKSGRFLFTLDLEKMVFGEFVDDQFHLFRYEIPPKPKKVIIIYRLVFSDGSKSAELYHLEASLREGF